MNACPPLHPVWRFLLACLTALWLAGCGGGSSQVGTDTAQTVQASGTVVDDQGIPLAAATVTVVSASAVAGTDQTVQTDGSGRFVLELDAGTPAVLRVDKAGYTRGFRAATAAADNASAASRVVLLPVASTQTFDLTQSAVLRVPGSPARVELAASSLVREDGRPISGSPTVALTPIDPSADIARMPGLLVDAVSGEPIESLGALTVSFTDASGAPLNLASGRTATIRIPATPAPGASLPATFPLYHLNETTGRWTQEGTATLQTDPATGAKYYEGTVSHFSTWNADQVMTRTGLDLSATLDGAVCTVPAGLRVVAQGVDYNGMTESQDNAFFARANSRVQLRLVDAAGTVLDALDMSTGAAGGSARPPRCLSVQQTVQLSGRVVVSSGSLGGYRVQISGDFPSLTLPMDAGGRYSTPIYRAAGAVSARLVRTDTRRDLPDTAVGATVAGSDVVLGDLIVTDTSVQLAGCLQGWAGFRQPSAQVSVWRGSTLLAAPFTATQTDPGFVFSVPIQSSLSLRITPPDASLAERVVNLSVGNTPPDLSTCLALPRGPQVQASSSGSGLVRNFDASATTPGDGTLTTFAWDFGDGASGSGAVVSHTYASAGTFTARLTVSDALGQRSVFSIAPDTSGGTVYSTLTAATALSLDSRNSCVIRDGNPWCWGYNGSQALGRSFALVSGDIRTANGLESSGVPVQISVGLTSATAVVNGDAHACALNANGTVQCWGSGVLGDGLSSKSVTPVTVSGISSAKAISGRDYATCAALADGSVRCWGNSSVGAPPVAIGGISDAVGVAAFGGTFGGTGDGCAVLTNGGVRCWGDNGYGRLGNGSEVDSATAVPVSGVSTAVAVATGDRSSCALLADGTVACWGEYSGGWFNNVVDHGPGGPAITVPGVSNAVALSMHGSRSCAVLADGSVMCWGTVADDGMTSSFTRRTTPVVAQGLSSVVSLALGQGHACALLGSGSVQCWGANSNGQLGTGGQVFRVDGVVQTPPTYPSSTTPQNVVGLP